MRLRASGVGLLCIALLWATLNASRSGAHDGHLHAPAGAWSFWPVYTLPGRAGGPVPDWMKSAVPVPPLSLEWPALLMDGERPTHRLGPIAVPGGLQVSSFSVEMWLLDHVNRPVGARVAARDRAGRDDPGWALDYHDGSVRFQVRPGSEEDAVELRVVFFG